MVTDVSVARQSRLHAKCRRQPTQRRPILRTQICRRRPWRAIMSELAAWLQAEGFGQYADLFASNAIDREALVELTDDHLKELGLPLGHRVKLLKAIRALERARGPASRRPGDEANATRARSGATAADRAVLRPGRVDGARGAARSRGHGRGDPGLSGHAAPRWSSAGAAMSPSTWAMACWPISAGRRRTRTTPSGRCRAGLALTEAVAGLADAGGRAARRRGSASRPGWSWSAS